MKQNDDMYWVRLNEAIYSKPMRLWCFTTRSCWHHFYFSHTFNLNNYNLSNLSWRYSTILLILIARNFLWQRCHQETQISRTAPVTDWVVFIILQNFHSTVTHNPEIIASYKYTHKSYTTMAIIRNAPYHNLEFWHNGLNTSSLCRASLWTDHEKNCW